MTRAGALMLVSILTVACGGHHHKAAPGPPATGPDPSQLVFRDAIPVVIRDPNPVVFRPGRLVPIGGGRTLYLRCEGSGRPTVILEAGLGGTSDDWREVQGPLSRQTRTCAYDRAGLGNSLPSSRVHGAADEISDLKRLLDHAGIAPPYVLVGTAYGGLLARVFAHAYPDQTAGIALVDAMGRGQDRRVLSAWRSQPAQIRQQIPMPTATPGEAGADLMASERLDATLGSLGRTRLVVITRGRPVDIPPLPPTLQASLEQLWGTMQTELAGLSSDSVHVIARRSGHLVQRTLNGQPGVVVAAVLAVVHAARAGAHLPACSRLFRGAGVQCRTR